MQEKFTSAITAGRNFDAPPKDPAQQLEKQKNAIRTAFSVLAEHRDLQTVFFEELKRYAQMDQQFLVTLRDCMSQKKRGRPAKPEWKNHIIATHVRILHNSGMSLEDAFAEVASLSIYRYMSDSTVKGIYAKYKNKLEVKLIK